MKKTINILILSFIGLLVACSTSEPNNSGIETDKQDIMVNGVYYDEKIPFSEEAENLFHLLRTDDSGVFTSKIINIKTGEILGETFWFDNGPDYFNNGVARFKKEGKVGLINKKGEIVLAPIYDFIRPMNSGYAVVENNCVTKQADDEHKIVECEKHGIVDSAGNIKIPVIYEDIHVGKLSVSINPTTNEVDETKPQNMNYHLFYKKKDGECNPDEVIIYSPYMEVFSNKGKEIKGGIYKKGDNKLRVLPLTSGKNSKTMYYYFENSECGVIEGEIPLVNHRTSSKFYLSFLTDNEKLTINSVTPGLNIDSNHFCKGSWGEYERIRINE